MIRQPSDYLADKHRNNPLQVFKLFFAEVILSGLLRSCIRAVLRNAGCDKS